MSGLGVWPLVNRQAVRFVGDLARQLVVALTFDASPESVGARSSVLALSRSSALSSSPDRGGDRQGSLYNTTEFVKLSLLRAPLTERCPCFWGW